MNSSPTIFNEISISSWEDYVSKISNKGYRNWMFRGQYDSSWRLESSLCRLFNDLQSFSQAYRGQKKEYARNKHEKELISQFKSQAHLFINHLPSGRGK